MTTQSGNIDLSDRLQSETLLAMQNYWKQSDWIRNMGASNIGNPCDRAVWMTWRYVLKPDFPPRLLRLFDRGHREEPVFIEELKSAGVKVYGCQETIVGYKGHFTAHPDGKAIGILEAPKTEHLLEFKTMSDKYFNQMVKKGVRECKPEYYDQMQIQMHLTGMTRAFFLAVNKNDDQLYAERIHYDPARGQVLADKTKRIIDSKQPPEKVESFTCKWCDMRGICFPEKMPHRNVPELNCRTCAFSTPVEGGRWVCEKFDNQEIPKDFQLTGCKKHLLIPGIIDSPVVASDGKTYVEYENGMFNYNEDYITPEGSEIDREDTLTHGVPF